MTGEKVSMDKSDRKATKFKANLRGVILGVSLSLIGIVFIIAICMWAYYFLFLA